MKQIIIAVVVVVGIIVGAMMLGGNEDSSTAGAVSNNWYGQENGIVTVTEYADFQCPACAQFYPLVKQVKEQFKDEVRFEFKHFPLVQIHPNATTAHRAAQAAAAQGKFWEMHDLLYEQQQAWSDSTSATTIFEGYAQQIGLDVEKYKIDAASSDILSIINADIDAGKNLNVTGTPTFFIDGKKIEDSLTISTLDGFTKVIQDAIDAKQSPTTETTQPQQ
jgi:protein-disulfide isomerase